MNTDRICPLFGKSFTNEPPADTATSLDQIKSSLKKEGLKVRSGTELDRFSQMLKKTKDALGKGSSNNHDDEEDSLVHQFLTNLSERQREKLLRKLSKVSKSDHRPKEKHRHH